MDANNLAVRRRKTGAKVLGLGAATATVAMVATALIAPVANADDKTPTAVSAAHGHTLWVEGLGLDVAGTGSSETNWTAAGPNNAQVTPLNLSLLGANANLFPTGLNLPLVFDSSDPAQQGLLDLGGLGVLNSYSESPSEIKSIASSGAVNEDGAIDLSPGGSPRGNAKIDLTQLLGQLGLTDLTDQVLDEAAIELGALAAYAEKDGTTVTTDYGIADLKLNLHSQTLDDVTALVDTTVGNVSTGLNDLVGTGGALTTTVQNLVNSLDAISIPIVGGLNAEMGALGIDTSSLLTSVQTELLNTPINNATTADGAASVNIDLSTGTIAVNLAELLIGPDGPYAGQSLSSLPANTDLLTDDVLNSIVSGVTSALTGTGPNSLTTKVVNIVEQGVYGLNVDLQIKLGVSLLGLGVTNTTITLQDAAGNPATIGGLLSQDGYAPAELKIADTGILGGLLTPVLNLLTPALTAILDLVGDVVTPLINGLAPALNTALTPLITDLLGGTDPLLKQVLEGVVGLTANEQPAVGDFGAGSTTVRALVVEVLPILRSASVKVELGSATVQSADAETPVDQNVNASASAAADAKGNPAAQAAALADATSNASAAATANTNAAAQAAAVADASKDASSDSSGASADPSAAAAADANNDDKTAANASAAANSNASAAASAAAIADASTAASADADADVDANVNASASASADAQGNPAAQASALANATSTASAAADVTAAAAAKAAATATASADASTAADAAAIASASAAANADNSSDTNAEGTAVANANASAAASAAAIANASTNASQDSAANALADPNASANTSVDADANLNASASASADAQGNPAAQASALADATSTASAAATAQAEAAAKAAAEATASANASADSAGAAAIASASAAANADNSSDTNAEGTAVANANASAAASAAAIADASTNASQDSAANALADPNTNANTSADPNANANTSTDPDGDANANPTPAPVYCPFVDLKNHKFEKPSQWMCTSGLSKGVVVKGETGRYYFPDNFTTRGAMAAFIYRMEGGPAELASGKFELPKKPTYRDVAQTNEFYRPIEWMAWKGYAAVGKDNVNYNPGTKTSRGQMAAFIYRLEKGAKDKNFTVPSKPSFVDTPKNHTFYRPIEWMKYKKLTVGVETSKGLGYAPSSPTSRGAMAAFLQRLDKSKN